MNTASLFVRNEYEMIFYFYYTYNYARAKDRRVPRARMAHVHFISGRALTCPKQGKDARPGLKQTKALSYVRVMSIRMRP